MTAKSLTARTIQGLGWSYVDTVVTAIMQIGYTAIMARLLSPADFGLVAMGSVVLRFGSYFAQMGLGLALVQKKELTKEDIQASFTSSVLLGVAMFGIFWFASPLAVFVFEDPHLAPVVRVMALSFVFTGLSVTALSLLRRNLAFRALALINIISYVLGYGIGGIGLALRGAGVWSLIAASLSQGVLTALLAYLLTRHSAHFVFKWRYFKPLYSFGARITLISFLEFIGLNLDTMAIGRFLGATALGMYNRAFMLIALPTQYFVTSFSRVMLPSYSRIQDDTPRLRRAYLSSSLLLGSVFFPICWGMVAAAQEIVSVILGPQWMEAIPLLQILAAATPFGLLTHLTGSLLVAKAELNAKLRIQIAYLLVLFALFATLGRLGVGGFAFAVAISTLVQYVLYMESARCILQFDLAQVSETLRAPVLSGAIVGLAIYVWGVLLDHGGMPSWLILVTQVTLGCVVLVVLFLYASWQKAATSDIKQRLNAAGYYPIAGSPIGARLARFGCLQRRMQAAQGTPAGQVDPTRVETID